MFKKIINPNNLKRGQYLYHIDHIISKYDGFINKIPINIISHPMNLRMIYWRDNIKKSKNSEITLEKLMEKINEFDKKNKK